MIDRKEGDGLAALSPTVSHGPEGHVVDPSETNASPSTRTICEGAPERKPISAQELMRPAEGCEDAVHDPRKGARPCAATAGIRIRTWGRAHIYGTAWWVTPDSDIKDESITHPLDEDQARWMIDRKEGEGDGLDAPSPTVSHGPEGHVVDSSRTHTSPSLHTI